MEHQDAYPEKGQTYFSLEKAKLRD